MYSIEVTKEARKALLKMPRNPFGAPHVKKLIGCVGYRLRVGDWRVIYDVESDRLVVRVLRIGSRGGVYE
ncbi:MAG: type II toxin-antitoxin system RelE/ParE family toxin [Burkholderiales bacterium]